MLDFGSQNTHDQSDKLKFAAPPAFIARMH